MKEGQIYANLWLCFTFVSAAKCLSNVDTNVPIVHYLDARRIIGYEITKLTPGSLESDLQIYCFRGNPKKVARYFESIELHLQIDAPEFRLFDGTTPEEILELYSARQSPFSFNWFFRKRTHLQLPPFQQHCIGVKTPEPYKVRLHHVRVDIWRVIQLLAGGLLFILAERLSHNMIFYYTTAVAFGICTFSIPFIFKICPLVFKFMQRYPVMYGGLVGALAMSIYKSQVPWGKVWLVLQTQSSEFYCYIFIIGSVMVMRSRQKTEKGKLSGNVVKWILQFASLHMIYCCSQYKEASVVLIILKIFIYWLIKYRKRRPPNIKGTTTGNATKILTITSRTLSIITIAYRFTLYMLIILVRFVKLKIFDTKSSKNKK